MSKKAHIDVKQLIKLPMRSTSIESVIVISKSSDCISLDEPHHVLHVWSEYMYMIRYLCKAAMHCLHPYYKEKWMHWHFKQATTSLQIGMNQQNYTTIFWAQLLLSLCVTLKRFFILLVYIVHIRI